MENQKLKMTHRILVPNQSETIERADGYAEELSDATTFELSDREYEDLRKEGGLLDRFDDAFGTIIDDFEEDRIESQDLPQAIEITISFLETWLSYGDSGAEKVLESLKYAEAKSTFWEIINGAELTE